MTLVKSKQRIAEHGEVFTPRWTVDEMLDLVKEESERITSRFLEPACGSGNFLVAILERKLASVEDRYGRSVFEKAHFSLLALMCIYGIELLEDNVQECRTNLTACFAERLAVEPTSALFKASQYVLLQNIVHGDAIKMQKANGKPITFAEWGYLGKGKFQRRDFRLDVLTGSAAFSAEGSLFAHLGKHELFTPTRTYAPVSIEELASESEKVSKGGK